MLDLTQIDEKTFFGKCVIESYPTNPEGTIQMIREQAKDNAEMIESIIGKENLEKILP